MKAQSAGLLMYRLGDSGPEFFLVHPGGPFWAKKDDGAWSVPKGLYEEGEEPLAAARREFQEEVGFVPDGETIELGQFKQPSGKVIAVWMVEGDFDPADLKSNAFSMEWPPKSAKMQEFPEVDRAAWFRPEKASQKITQGQRAVLTRALLVLGQPEALGGEDRPGNA